MKYIVIALIGALASVLSNQGIAVFNDGFRPIVGQYFNGEINRKELAAMSFAISFGLVIGFGIPTIQYDKEVIINGIENKSNLYCSQNFQNINIIYAEYIK